MIISASRRTDIPAFYTQWFVNRVRAGYCTVPNPFNPGTVISFDLPRAERARLTVYDLRGRLVRTLVDGIRGGRQSVTWDGRDRDGRSVAAGVYLVRLRTASGRWTRATTLVR